MLRAELTDSYPIMDKKTDNKEFIEKIQEILLLLKKALVIYVSEGRERVIENEEYELYKKQYPFDEFYYFKEEFKIKWE